MYALRWSSGLRQGDILRDVLFPSLAAQYKVISTETSFTTIESAKPTESMIVGAERQFVAVVSHDCEFNEGKRNRLLLARIETIPKHLTPEQLDALRASNDIHARAEAGLDVAGVDSFVLDPLPGCFDDERAIVFTTITPFPMKMHGEFVKAKRAELEHDVRVLLRNKIALFFGRPGDDIPDEEKVDQPSLADVDAESTS